MTVHFLNEINTNCKRPRGMGTLSIKKTTFICIFLNTSKCGAHLQVGIRHQSNEGTQEVHCIVVVLLVVVVV
jgi:hypothetical protein